MNAGSLFGYRLVVMLTLLLASGCVSGSPEGKPPLDDSAIDSPVDSGSDSASDSGPPDDTDPDTGPATLVLITLDTFRADHIGEATPFLVALAAEGLELPDLDTHSWTYPGIGAVVTGVHPTLWGIESWTFDREPDEMPYGLSPDIRTLAEALGDLGWASAYWNSNPIAGDKSGLDRGYDRYTEFNEGATVTQVPAILAWLEENRGKPRFLHLHVNDAHSPYDLLHDACEAEVRALDDGTCRWDFVANNEDSLFANNEVADGRFAASSADYAACQTLLAAAYRCEVRKQDQDLGEVWAELTATGELEGALTVVAIDHGEGLLDPWTNHGFDLRGPVLDGWGALHWPGRIAPGRLDLPLGQEDIVPTIASLLALDLGMDTSGLPFEEVPADRVRTTFFGGPLANLGSAWGHVRGAYDNEHRLIVDTRGTCSLYDLVADPTEQNNLCGELAPPEHLVTATTEVATITEGFAEEAPRP